MSPQLSGLSSYYLTGPVAQESGCDFTRSSVWRICEDAIRVLAGAVVSSEGLIGEGPDSELVPVVVVRIQFLKGFQMEGLCPLFRAALSS